MGTVTLERAVEVVRALGPEEQQKLRVLMDSWPVETLVEPTPEQERQFAEHLLAQGVLSHIPTGDRLYPDPEPIVVLGEPISETIIRERR